MSVWKCDPEEDATPMQRRIPSCVEAVRHGELVDLLVLQQYRTSLITSSPRFSRAILTRPSFTPPTFAL